MRKTARSHSLLGVLNTTTPAVILKLDPNAMHHGGLGAIRSLGRLGVPVYGVHEDLLAPAAHSRYLHGRWIWRPTAEDTGHLRAGLMALAARIGRPAVLIPTDDAGALFLAEHGHDLRAHFLFPDPPSELPRQLAGKYTLYQLCNELGVPCAATALPESLVDAQRFAERVGFPVMAKLATPWRWRSARGLRSTSVVHSPGELTRIWQACADSHGAGSNGADSTSTALMLQEYIPAGQDYFFHSYCDTHARCRAAYVGIKERSYPAHAGLTSFGRWVDNPRLHRQATELVARLGFRGIVDLDYRLDSRDGQYKLLDFNPRLGAQFRLFEDTAGVDVVIAAYLDLTGRVIPPGSPYFGRSFLVENYDPIAALAYRRTGLDFRSWVASLRRVDELAWFARDDLAPFGLMCLRMGWRSITRPRARRRTHRPVSTPLTARRAPA